MSYKNPNSREVIENSTSNRELTKHLDRTALSNARWKFYTTHKKKSTIEDSQAIFDLFVEEWTYHNKTKPALDKMWYKKATPIYKALIPFKIDVYAAACRYIEYINNSFVECPSYGKSFYNPIYGKVGYVKVCCSEIIGNEDAVRYIIKNGHQEGFIKWAKKNKKHLNKHFKGYEDFSDLAYNGVTDDF